MGHGDTFLAACEGLCFLLRPHMWGLSHTHSRICTLLIWSQISKVQATFLEMPYFNLLSHLPPYSTQKEIFVISWFSDERCHRWENLQQLLKCQKLSKRRENMLWKWVKTLLCSECPAQPQVWSFQFGFWSLLPFKLNSSRSMATY